MNSTQESCTGPEDLFIEPVYAIREFLLGLGGDVRSQSRWFAWKPGETHVAECKTFKVTGADHDAPAPVEECTCGFYGWNNARFLDDTRTHLYGWLPVMNTYFGVGVVALTGRILVGEKGYRAECAKLVALGGPWSWTWGQKRDLGVPLYRTVENMLQAFPLSKIEMPCGPIKSSALDKMDEAS